MEVSVGVGELWGNDLERKIGDEGLDERVKVFVRK